MNISNIRRAQTKETSEKGETSEKINRKQLKGRILVSALHAQGSCVLFDDAQIFDIGEVLAPSQCPLIGDELLLSEGVDRDISIRSGNPRRDASVSSTSVRIKEIGSGLVS